MGILSAGMISSWGDAFGEGQYKECFPVIVEGTTEKIVTSEHVGKILAKEAAKGFGLANERAVVCDIGSDDALTLIRMLKNIDFSPNTALDIRVLDYKPLSVLEAQKNLTAAKAFLPIENVFAAEGNAYAGNLQEQLGLMPHTADVVILSHLMYCISKNEFKTLFDDVFDDLLDPNGICILAHVNMAPNSFLDFRNRFGTRADAKEAKTEGRIVDATEEIIRYCEEKGCPLETMEYKVEIRFPILDPLYWELLRDPNNFSVLENDPGVADWIKNLAFIALRTPQEMAKKGDWVRFLDAIRPFIENGLFYTPVRLQIIRK